VSDIFRPKIHRKGAYALLFLLAAAAFCAGCLGAKPYVPTSDDEALFKAKGVDKTLYEAIRKGENDYFVIVAVFKHDVFLMQSAALEQSSIPVLSELGKAALLLVRANEVLPMLRDPSMTKAVWFGSQGSLARLDPSLELDMLGRFGKGDESKPVAILARFYSVPGAAEEKAITAAGFEISTKSGPTLIISGPVSGIPKLLERDQIAYLEKGNFP